MKAQLIGGKKSAAPVKQAARAVASGGLKQVGKRMESLAAAGRQRVKRTALD